MHTRNFIDQLNRVVEVKRPVQRIVSLVPSQTELLHDLGLSEKVVGITRFCVHPPEWQKTKAIVGGTKKFNVDVIDSLKPDLIIGNKEENYQEGIYELQRKYSVWMSDIITLNDALGMIKLIGEITETERKANHVLLGIRHAFETLPTATPHKVLYLIWKNPWMAAGQHTFINSMIQTIGWQNVSRESRYPELTIEGIQSLSPAIILLSTEPYPFRKQHADELQRAVPTAKVLFVDGEMFSWYGSRLLNAPAYFKQVTDEL